MLHATHCSRSTRYPPELGLRFHRLLIASNVLRRLRKSFHPVQGLLLLVPTLLLLHLRRRLSYSHATSSATAFAHELLRRPSQRAPGTVLLVETQFNGLGAQLLRHLDALALASHLGWSFSPCFGRYWNYGCGPYRSWECYFTPSPAADACARKAGCPELSTLSVEKLSRQDCVLISGNESAERAAAVMARMAHGKVTLPRRLSRRLWSLNDETRAAVDAVLIKTGVPQKGSYVGVHVRRGDKSKEVGSVALWRYAKAVRVLSEGDTPVFVASDDGAAVEALRGALAERRVLAVAGAARRTGHEQAGMNRLYLKHNYGRVVELLAEIEALACASVFVGTFSSNLGRLVHVLRQGEINGSVSLDDRWKPGVAWRTFGERYCEAEEANRVYCELFVQRGVGRG